MDLEWKVNFWGKNIIITKAGMPVGYVKHSESKITAEIEGKVFIFHDRGIFAKRFEIYQEPGSIKLGEIRAKEWSGVSITFDKSEHEYNLKYLNFWRSKWAILEDGQDLITFYARWWRRGRAESNGSTPNALLCLVGLIASEEFRLFTINDPMGTPGQVD